MKKINALLTLLLSLTSLTALGAYQNTYAVDDLSTSYTADALNVDAEQRIEGYLVASPVSFQLGIVVPGASYTGTFTTANIGQKPVTFTLTSEAFGVKNNSYDAVYSEPTNRTRLSEWITFPDGTTHTLQPEEQKKITFQASIPTETFGGGQYAAIMINLQPIESDSPLQVNTRIALPVYSTIDGDITYSGKVTDQSIQSFSFDPKIISSSTIENSGNADFEATYSFKVSSIGDSTILHEKTETKIIIPETTRIFTQEWSENAPALGIFKVTQEITYLDSSGEQATATKESTVIICPLWLILITATIIILIITSLILKIRKRNQA